MQKRRLGNSKLEGARDRVCHLQPARERVSHGQDRREDGVRQHRLPQHAPRFTPEARKANQALIDLLVTIGQRKQATPAQIALGWLLARAPWIVPIPGTTRLPRLEENISAASIELTSDDLREIEHTASRITVHGTRYPEQLEQLTGR